MGKQDKTRRETLQCLTHTLSPNGFTFQSCILNVKKFRCFSNGDISLKNDIATATMLRTKTQSPTWKEKTTTRVHSGLMSCPQLGGPRPQAPLRLRLPDEGPRRPRLALGVGPHTTRQEKPRCASHLQPRGPSCATHSPNMQPDCSQVTGLAGRRLTWDKEADLKTGEGFQAHEL